MEVVSRSKGLDLIDRGPEEIWTEVCDIVQEVVIKTIAKGKKKMQKGKMAVSAGLANSCEKRRNEKQRRKAEI